MAKQLDENMSLAEVMAEMKKNVDESLDALMVSFQKLRATLDGEKGDN